jgi:hypothetical protein
MPIQHKASEFTIRTNRYQCRLPDPVLALGCGFERGKAVRLGFLLRRGKEVREKNPASTSAGSTIEISPSPRRLSAKARIENSDYSVAKRISKEEGQP